MLGEKVEEMGEGGQRGRKENKSGKGMRLSRYNGEWDQKERSSKVEWSMDRNEASKEGSMHNHDDLVGCIVTNQINISRQTIYFTR